MKNTPDPKAANPRITPGHTDFRTRPKTKATSPGRVSETRGIRIIVSGIGHRVLSSPD
jgi:hypothetical protein